MSSEYGNFRFDSPSETDQVLLEKSLPDWPTCRTVRQSTEDCANRKCSMLPVTGQEVGPGGLGGRVGTVCVRG